MNSLRVRAYNVRFGDAILVSIPDREDGRPLTRHLLIDVGNVLGGSEGDDAVFRPVVEDILNELNGRPVDLYVMSHEHLDHVQGLPFAEGIHVGRVPVDHAWLTGSTHPDYYKNNDNARRKRLDLLQAYEAVTRSLAPFEDLLAAPVRAMMLNNNPQKTSECVEYLRGLARRTWYVDRETEIEGKHPFQEARLTIWAPERDTSIYYGRFRPTDVVLSSAGGPAGDARGRPTPPPGVDAGAFYDLVDFRRQGFLDAVLAIDQAANNTSVVFSLEWRGWRLLFPGDAEIRSWREMNKQGMLQPVHFLKVSHHGSPNGTPPSPLLDKILPNPAPDGRERRAVVSTFEGAYHGVPDTPTLDELRRRCLVKTVEGLPLGGFRDVEFSG